MACSRLLLVIFFFILSLNSVQGVNSAKPKKKREAPSSSPPPTFLNEAMKFLFHTNQAKLKYEAPSSSSPPPPSTFSDEAMKFLFHANLEKLKYEAPSSSSPPPPASSDEAMNFFFHTNQEKLKYEAPSSSSPPPASSDEAIKFLFHTNQEKLKYEAPSSSSPPPPSSNEAMKFLFHTNQEKLKYEAPSSSSPSPPPSFSSFNITNNENLPANLTNLPINFFEYDFVSIGTQMLTTFSNQGRNDNLFPKSDPKWTNKSWSTKPECGVSTITGEIRGCVDSKESMFKFVMPIMGTRVKGLTTPPGKLQFYRVMGPVRTIHNRVTTCHNKGDLSLPYAVYGCHYIPNSRVRVVPLLGADGTRLEALIVCHMDTSSWNPKGFVLQLLNREPGPPVCHFMSTDDLLWVV